MKNVVTNISQFYGCPSLPIKKNKNKNKNNKFTKKSWNKKKQKNWKNEKNIIQKNTPQNYHGPWVPNLIKKIFIQKDKKNYDGLRVPNLILSYQALYTMK